MSRVGQFLSAVLLVALSALSLGGCASTLHLASKKHLQKFEGGSQPVYVTNPELRREYAILRDSHIYQLSTNPHSARRLTLQPLDQGGRCLNPLLLTYLSFGIIPGWLPAASTFRYELTSQGNATHFAHPLPLYERISLWEALFYQNRERVLAQSLALSGRGTVSGPEAVPAYRKPISAPLAFPEA